MSRATCSATTARPGADRRRADVPAGRDGRRERGASRPARWSTVHSDGPAELLTEGILRARYRHSLSAPEPLEPGQVHELLVDLWATSNVFGVGHSIRLEASSSNFPRFDRNPNTGGVIATTGADELVTAITTVHHDRLHLSRVTLPIIHRG